jgi:hypothetical protein
MAQLVIAAAGAAIGGFLAPGAVLLGMSGAQLGWMAGSMLGSMVGGKQRSSGPRLDELRVSGTEYGGGIAWVAGAPRVAGDLIWASDRREMAKTETAGKGGGGSEYTSYTYELDAMYLLADQPDAICTRIWDNGKLIWTNLAAADDASRIASEQTSKWRRITVYSGTDAQLPDPTYDAATLNAPAYTRRLTVFIEGMQLGSSGSLPNLTFEVVAVGDTNPNFVRRYEVSDTGRQFADLSNAGLGFPALLAIQPSVRLTIQHATSNIVYLSTLDGTTAGTTVRGSGEDYPELPGNNGGTVVTNFPVGMLDGDPVRCANHFYALGTATHIRAGAKLAGAWDTGVIPDLADVLPAGRFMGDTMPCSDGLHLLVLTAPTTAYSGGTVLNRWHIIKRDTDGITPVLVSEGDIETARQWKVYGNAGQKDFTHQCGILEDDLKHVWIAYGAGTGWLEMLKIEPDGVMRRRSLMDAALLLYGFTYPTIWAEGGFCVVVSRQSYAAFRRAGDVITDVPLQDVVESLCDRATMPAGTYDATALASITAPVRALAVTNGSARQALEILQASHGFDAYVTDKLRFVPRGGASVQTIDPDDLAAGNGEAGDEPFELTVNDDLEIPSRIAVIYRNMDADQVNGTEHSERGPTVQDSIQSVQLAIGMTPAEAKGVADAMVRDGYASRLTSRLSLPLDYTHLTPTDVIQVPDSDGTLYRMRITRRSDSGGTIALDVVGDDGAVVVQQMTTSTDYTPQVAVETLAATVLVLLDIPLLRDADDGLGMYVAARGETGKWPGCVVYRSNDGTVFSESVADISDAAVLGHATSVLPSWSGGAIFDHGSSVLVDVGPGQLSSATPDQLQGDAELNALMIGSELVRFTTAALQSTAPNIYRISGLLRGQRGTEWATGGHASGEAVVLLRMRGLRRITLAQADLGQTRYFKGVTRGALVTDSAAVSIVPMSIGQKPRAPVDLRSARDADGNITLSWKRRTRMESNFTGPTGSAVPLGEASERYELEVYSGSSVVRSVALTERSFRYTTSMQTSDFGGLQGAVSARVYQMGANGRGYPLAATVGDASAAAIVRTVTLGGTFTVGLTISVRSGSLLLAAYTTKSADTNLTGVATALAAAITAGSAGYTATSAGAVVTVTGPLGVSYTLSVDVSGASSTDVDWYYQRSVVASAATRWTVDIYATNILTGDTSNLPAGTVLGFYVRRAGVLLGPLSYTATSLQTARDALLGLQRAFQGSTLAGLGYQLISNVDTLGIFYLRLQAPAGATDAQFVDASAGGYRLGATVQIQGADAIPSDLPQISDVTIYGTPVAGEVYRIELGPTTFFWQLTSTPTNYDYTAVGGDTAASVAAGLAALIDPATYYLAAASDRGLGGASNTVRITGATTVPFVNGLWSVRAFIQRAIFATVS